MLCNSWRNAIICLNYGAFSLNTFKEKEGCGYMDNSPLSFELPTYPQHCYYFLNFLKNKGDNKGLNSMLF